MLERFNTLIKADPSFTLHAFNNMLIEEEHEQAFIIVATNQKSFENLQVIRKSTSQSTVNAVTFVLQNGVVEPLEVELAKLPVAIRWQL